jgi:hypothetical protein
MESGHEPEEERRPVGPDGGLLLPDPESACAAEIAAEHGVVGVSVMRFVVEASQVGGEQSMPDDGSRIVAFMCRRCTTMFLVEVDENAKMQGISGLSISGTKDNPRFEECNSR